MTGWYQMKSDYRFKESTRRSAPAVQNRTGGMPSGPGQWDGLAHLNSVSMPATSNEIENNLAEVSMGRISECGFKNKST